MPNLVRSDEFRVRRKKQNALTTNYQLPTTNQRGFSQIILPLFLLAAIGLSVFLVQQQTNLIPFAQEPQVPDKCDKITPISRTVCYRQTENSNPVECVTKGPTEGEQPNDHPGYAIKEITWTWSNNWKSVGQKGALQSDGDRLDTGTTKFKHNDKSYNQSNEGQAVGNKDLVIVEYGDGTVREFAYTKVGTNYQGVTTNPDGTPARTYDPGKSYAYVPKEGQNVKCGGNAADVGFAGIGETCDKGNHCKSGLCNNNKCVQGTKAAGDACPSGQECASNKCSDKKCVAGTTSNSTNNTTRNGTNNTTNNTTRNGTNNTTNNTTRNGTNNTTNGTTNNTTGTINTTTATDSWQEVDMSRCIQACGPTFPTGPEAKCYFRQSRNLYNCSRSIGSQCENNNWCDSGFCDLSKKTCQVKTTGTGAQVTLTKAEITGFKASYDAFYPKLGAAKDTGNLKVVSTIANTELASIVAELPTCPDDANVGTCVDSKFRLRFDLAKTAARLSAFYATFNSIPGACVKADLGLNPLISATSQAGSTGRVNLCTDRLVASRIWMIFAGGKFVPVLSTDTKYPQNPTCAGD